MRLKAAREAFHIRGTTYSLAGARAGDHVPMDVGVLANAGPKGTGKPGGSVTCWNCGRADHKSPGCYRPPWSQGGRKRRRSRQQGRKGQRRQGRQRRRSSSESAGAVVELEDWRQRSGERNFTGGSISGKVLPVRNTRTPGK